MKLKAEKWVQNGFCIAHPEKSQVKSIERAHQAIKEEFKETPTGQSRETPTERSLNPSVERSSAIFVKHAIPGEEFDAEILREKSTHSFALAKDFYKQNENRLASDCDSFPKCGGCFFRHISYSDEQKVKLDLLHEFKTLKETFEKIRPEVFFDKPDHYRNRVRIHSDGRRLGFFEMFSNNIVEIPHDGCKQLDSSLNEKIHQLRDEKQLQKGEISLTSIDTISTPNDLTWKMPEQSFAQANQFLIDPWLRWIRDRVSYDSKIIELFCGAGIIAGSVGDKITSYTGYDSDKGALSYAKINFSANNLNGKFIREDLYKTQLLPKKSDIFIVNPPRAGLKGLVNPIIQSAPKKIIYSSCLPASLDRDLRLLFQSGYQAKSWAIFDFFPRTPHVEVIVELAREGES